MDFKQATDRLLATLPHEDLAKALGVSVPAIRQARLRDGARARRNPPAGWRAIVIRIAEERVWHYRRLIEDLQADNREE